MTSYTSYVNNLNGTEYGLPSTFTGSFRETPYTPAAAGASDPTRSNARIRALAYVWMVEAEVITAAEDPSESGKFINNLSPSDNQLMRNNNEGGTIALLSDCGYASNSSGEIEDVQCDDGAGGANPWDFFTDAFGDKIKTYFTPSKDNDTNLPEGYNSLDIWQATGTQLLDAQADVVIVSDIVQLCAPTQYGQNNGQTFPQHSDEYVKVLTVFGNLFAMTKPGGRLIFSVPYDGDPTATTGTAVEVISVDSNNVECNLWNWDYTVVSNNSVITNTPNGGTETTEEVDFTGGINCPAILRTFTRGAVHQYLSGAQFTNIDFHPITDNMNKIGVFWDATIDNGAWTANNSDSSGNPGSKSLIVTATRPPE